MSVEAAILTGAATATIGWLYTARRQRTLSRKQHTFNALLQMGFSPDFEERVERLVPYIRKGEIPDDYKNMDLEKDLKKLLNHYEFLAAGIRNGDIDEKLLFDSEYGLILKLLETAKPYIDDARNERQLDDIFEHLEWLEQRWRYAPPARFQQLAELIYGRPFYDWPPIPRTLIAKFRETPN